MTDKVKILYNIPFLTLSDKSLRKAFETSLWLMDYYSKKEGLLFTGQWEAIQYKIDEIVDKCKIIMFYDNRETAAHQVVFIIRNGICIVNNLQIKNLYEISKSLIKG